MNSIKVLDSLLANQIAAGEVVERPASVVKELVENAIDAGATSIHIECKHGGSERILIRDNGKGIAKQDMSLACVRHATSKISSYEDLVHVASLGFRGEALASVASVAKLDITSHHMDADSAWQLSIDGSRGEPLIKPASHPVGTTINVKQLFYNTPARKRFLRTDKTEFGHVETVVLRQALSRFDIAFRLMHNDKLVFDMPVANTVREKEQRIAKVFGNDFIQAAILLDFEAAGLRLSGWVADAHYNRAQPDQQYAYINGRFIRDKMVMSALKSAYQSIMFHGRHAAYVLFLECEPGSVDVNVHPTKHEVRFRDGRTEYQFIVKSIKQALADQRISADDVPLEQPKPIEYESIDPGGNERIDMDTGEVVTVAKPSVIIRPAVSAGKAVQTGLALRQSYAPTKRTIASSQANDVQKPVEPAGSEQSEVHQPSESGQPLGVAIAQLHDIYILAQNEQGLIVVDMHAAHERVLFEQMKKQMADKQLTAQGLLMPITVDVSSNEMAVWHTIEACLQQLSFEIDCLSDNQLVVRQVPQLLARANIVELIRDMLVDAMSDDWSNRADHLVDTIMANMACKAAVKAHHKMTLQEMNHLLRKMESIPHGGLCNHGRPAWKQFTLRDVDKWFLRGQ